VARSYRIAFVLDLVLGIINLLIFFFISRTFRGGSVHELQGAPSYFAFAAVGIAVTVVIEAASTGLSRRIRDEQLTGTLEVLVAQPLSALELSLGLAGYPFLFAMGRAAFYILVAAALLGLDLHDADWLGFALVLLASGVALSSIGVLLGAAVLVVKRGQMIAGLVTFGMGLVSGAFFPVSVLPAWIRPLGTVVPTRFAFDGLRSALYRGTGWADDVFWLFVFAAIGIPVAIKGFTSALDYSKRAGTLSQY